MNRTIEQWKSCDPKVMATQQSDAAITFAFEDAQQDILELHRRLQKAQAILKVIAYPCRGTAGEHLSLQDFADLIQANYSLGQLEGKP